ncbi:MAG TPA: hypothetical protein VI895_07445 [Bdellovibrionota bacterium]|nr:hypothetical protein [Bdellovibrionota bacterium]
MKVIKWGAIIFSALILALGTHLFLKARSFYKNTKEDLKMVVNQSISPATGQVPETKTTLGKILSQGVQTLPEQLNKTQPYSPMFRDAAAIQTVSAKQLRQYEMKPPPPAKRLVRYGNNPPPSKEPASVVVGPFTLHVERIWPLGKWEKTAKGLSQSQMGSGEGGYKIQVRVWAQMIPGLKDATDPARVVDVKSTDKDGNDLAPPPRGGLMAIEGRLMFLFDGNDHPYLTSAFDARIKEGGDIKSLDRIEGAIELRLPADSTEICAKAVPGEKTSKNGLELEILPGAIPRMRLKGNFGQLLAIKGFSSTKAMVLVDQHKIDLDENRSPLITPKFKTVPASVCLYVAKTMTEKTYPFSLKYDGQI